MEKSFEVSYELVQPLTHDLVNKLAVVVGHCNLLSDHLKAGSPSAKRVGRFGLCVFSFGLLWRLLSPRPERGHY
jgi:hypothetical protein